MNNENKYQNLNSDEVSSKNICEGEKTPHLPYKVMNKEDLVRKLCESELNWIIKIAEYQKSRLIKEKEHNRENFRFSEEILRQSLNVIENHTKNIKILLKEFGFEEND